MMDQCKRTNSNLKNLIGENWESLISQIPRSVLIRISPEASMNPTGQMITGFTINMLIRLYPVVSDIFLECQQDAPINGHMPNWQGDTLLKKIESMYKEIQPKTSLLINTKEQQNEISSHITIGTGEEFNKPRIWVGSENWLSNISSLGPQPLSPVINPVGAYAAATLAVSETWKRILLPIQNKVLSIRITPLNGVMNFSTFDYSMSGASDNPQLPEEIDLNRITMIGLGAGGGAAAYTIASLSDAKGKVTLIDPDEVEASNLNRYVYADRHDAELKIKKVQCIKKLFKKFGSLKIRELPVPYLSAQANLNIEDYRQVVAAVDNRKTRREIQYQTPEVILDAAATETGDFFIWRMEFGQTECMLCKHPENHEDFEKIQAEQLSMAFGLTPKIWLRITGNNDMFSEIEVEEIRRSATSSNPEVKLPELGQRFQEWFQKNCGRLELPEIEGGIPIPFAPVMAGILQAGEVIKRNLFPDSVLNGYYWNTLTARFNPHIKPRIKPPSKECCFCQDKVFIEQYNRRWRR